ncbi:hypothetical protein AB0M28_12460 [Streptomyces sp. NPDC051940]|uniref:hypothetical protein n=1 Tax=Streptomyces sp. NPDC051940 TaxID=3155675 RepID=UPI003416939D
MGYVLEAVIAGERLLAEAMRESAALRVAPLGQGLSLMPVTESLYDAFTDGSDRRPYGFRRLPGGFELTLARWSAAGPVAYVEVEFFGGRGEQRAVVWHEGAVVLGPLFNGEDERFAAEGSPVSQALRRLGAVAGAEVDEFWAVGLQRHRGTDDWLGG